MKEIVFTSGSGSGSCGGNIDDQPFDRISDSRGGLGGIDDGLAIRIGGAGGIDDRLATCPGNAGGIDDRVAIRAGGAGGIDDLVAARLGLAGGIEDLVVTPGCGLIGVTFVGLCRFETFVLLTFLGSTRATLAESPADSILLVDRASLTNVDLAVDVALPAISLNLTTFVGVSSLYVIST